ncbi:MAG: ATP-binding protein [Prevotella sp.]|mgnify:FL=1|nr:ATP-binding protein [Prevotella sp.]MDD7709268.1 ATP-binding protein [Prevotella sp.]MDY4150945.1 ATP-binding protein [Prevotella sp.]
MRLNNRTLTNPFIYQGYESPKYFCDREVETKTLLSHLKNGRNVTLISPRRIGKTGLIKNTFYHLKEQEKDATCLYIDIFATKNLHDFVELLGVMVINEIVRKNASFIEKTISFFSALRPVLSMDPLTGEPSVSITVEPSKEDITIQSIFNYLNDSEQEVYIAIDEFQQIAEYPEKGTEALLRSYIQFAQHVHFIFSGSKFHLMAEIFGSPKHPFYQSTEMMGLKPLDSDVYYDFCLQFFKEKGGNIEKDIFEYLYNMFEGHTWYIQCIMNRLYEANTNVESTEQVNAAILSILAGREPQFESLSQFFTDNQFSLLKAIAKEGIVAQPTAGRFIKSHNLSGASSTKAALKVLEDKELVYRKPEGYIIYDRFMDLWLKRL